MIVATAQELKRQIKPQSRLLGFDVGSKTVGLALSDTSLIVATPYKTLIRKKFAPLAEELCQIIVEMEVGGMVIGLPLSMDGSEGPRCRASRHFADNMLKVLGDQPLPTFFQDERLSTAAVERMLINEADMNRKRRAQVIDKTAAAYILQGTLDIMG